MSYIKQLRELVGTQPIILTGACVLLIDPSGRLLMQQRTDNGLWGLPGGSMELGEELREVASRELYEEVGLTANQLELFDVFSGPDLYYKYPNGDEVYNVVTAYICKDYSGTIRGDGDEVQDIQFFEFDKLRPSLINPADLPVIKKYMNGSHSKCPNI